MKSTDESARYLKGCGEIGTGGLKIGKIAMRVRVLPVQGMRRLPNGAMVKVFGETEADVPLQMVLRANPAPDPRFEDKPPIALAKVMPVGSEVLVNSGRTAAARAWCAATAPAPAPTGRWRRARRR